MLKENASEFVKLGQAIYDVSIVFDWDNYAPIGKDGLRKLNEKGVDAVQVELRKLRDIARRLKLRISVALLDRHLPESYKCPQTTREMDNIVAIFHDEIASRKCLFIPSHLEQYFESEELVSDVVLDAFPNAFEEIRNSGTALSCGMFTASVFHAMRAVEIGLRSMHSAFPLAIKGNKPVELAEWREILDALSGVAFKIENLPNADPTKEPDQHFVSEACAQFRFFKNGWRVRVAHARATYDEAQAQEALTHVRSFFEVLAKRLKEI